MKVLVQPALVLSLLISFISCNKSDDYFAKEVSLVERNGDLPSPNENLGDPPSQEPDIPVKDVVDSDLCKENPKAEACVLEPVVTKTGVVTILLALGDIAQNKVVITEDSARLIAVNAVKFASPVQKPKILVVKDSNHRGESIEDTEYIAKVLLSNYETTLFYEKARGLLPEDLIGYDIVWFNNPGYPMGKSITYETLLSFQGGVILSGDDLTQGSGFKIQDLTGLRHIDNGTSVKCDGRSFNHDNNKGYRYQVSLEKQFLPGIPESLLNFEYGNDIDDSALASNDQNFEVLAYATGAPGTCVAKRPVIVRYEK